MAKKKFSEKTKARKIMEDVSELLGYDLHENELDHITLGDRLCQIIDKHAVDGDLESVLWSAMSAVVAADRACSIDDVNEDGCKSAFPLMIAHYAGTAAGFNSGIDCKESDIEDDLDTFLKFHCDQGVDETLLRRFAKFIGSKEVES